MDPTILIFLIAIGAKLSYYLKSIATQIHYREVLW